MRRSSVALGLVGVVLLGGCLIEPYAEEHLLLSVRTDLPVVSTSRTLSGSPWDSQGLFRLGTDAQRNQYPKLAWVTVEATGRKPTTGSWPDPQRGVGPGEGTLGEVTVELIVPSGQGATLRALGFLVKEGTVRLYREKARLVLDLSPGALTEATLEMTEQEAGRLEVTLRCQEGTTAIWKPQSLALVDAEAQVLFPSQALQTDAIGSQSAVIDPVAVGRPHWMRVYMQTSDGKQSRTVDLRQPTYTVGAKGQSLPLNLVLPCS